MNVLALIEERAGVTVTPETSLEELQLDSLELADLLTELDIPPRMDTDLMTVGDLMREARC